MIDIVLSGSAAEGFLSDLLTDRKDYSISELFDEFRGITSEETPDGYIYHVQEIVLKEVTENDNARSN